VKQLYSLALGLALAAPLAATAQAQPSSANSDLYHVHFTKALPGQATALADFLKKPDTSSPMPEHFVVLRHQQGDDWDYVVIQHLGAKATVDPAGTPPNAGRDIRAWHTDTFASGPSWGEFAKAVGIGQATGSTGGSVYSVAVWRAAAGHREPLEKLLREAPAGAAGAGSVVLTHVEGVPPGTDLFRAYLSAMIQSVPDAAALSRDALDGLLTELRAVLRPDGRASVLWRSVMTRVPEALEQLQALGLRLVVVSNSDGTVEQSLETAGLRRFLSDVVDSAHAGYEKPDPRIFTHALERSGADPARTLHVGDLYHADVAGARGAGVLPVLLDPYGDWPDVDCERAADLWEVASRLAAARRSP
jgi:putative hydrolase of the HAD superfamily